MVHICISNVENHIQLWEILSNMKLTSLATKFCVFRAKAAQKKSLICLYQKCWTLRGIQCYRCYSYKSSADKDISIMYFPSLHFFNVCHYEESTVVQDVVNTCKELKCAVFYCFSYRLSLNLVSTALHFFI